MEDLKKVMLILLGSAAISVEKLDKSLSDLIAKGKLTVKEGKDLREELIREDGYSNDENAKNLFSEKELKEFLKSLNLATKEEFNKLNERLTKVEEKIDSN